MSNPLDAATLRLLAQSIHEAVEAGGHVADCLVLGSRGIASDEMAYVKARRAGRAGNAALEVLYALCLSGSGAGQCGGPIADLLAWTTTTPPGTDAMQMAADAQREAWQQAIAVVEQHWTIARSVDDGMSPEIRTTYAVLTALRDAAARALLKAAAVCRS